MLPPGTPPPFKQGLLLQLLGVRGHVPFGRQTLQGLPWLQRAASSKVSPLPASDDCSVGKYQRPSHVGLPRDDSEGLFGPRTPCRVSRSCPWACMTADFSLCPVLPASPFLSWSPGAASSTPCCGPPPGFPGPRPLRLLRPSGCPPILLCADRLTGHRTADQTVLNDKGLREVRVLGEARLHPEIR